MDGVGEAGVARRRSTRGGVFLQLKPGLRRAWRGPGSVQLGLGPPHGQVLVGLTPADVAALDLIAAGVNARQLAAGGERAQRLSRLLCDAGAVVSARAGAAVLTRLGPERAALAEDAAAWSLLRREASDGWELVAARSTRRVDVVGAGRVARAVAETLTASGVGSVRVVAEPAGRRPARRPATPDPAARPDLVVLVHSVVADAARADPLLRGDIDHLCVVVREGDVVVGPLVRPGTGPCLRCLDLHRSDRDPRWPSVLAQLLADSAPLPQESALARLAGALAAMQALACLDGLREPASLAATLEVEPPDGLVSRRPWPAHPGCGCQWPSPGATPPSTVRPRARTGAPTAGKR